MSENELKIIRNQFCKNFTKLDKKLFEQYRKHLNEWVRIAMKKFITGRIEHEDDINGLDCEYEIEQEIMDITAYQFLRTQQSSNIKT